VGRKVGRCAQHHLVAHRLDDRALVLLGRAAHRVDADGDHLARALVAGGLPMLEVTLRSEVALDALRAIRDAEARPVAHR
jgi:2-keto-3-deoxy-6-phosphogluconate aldolase